MHSISGVPSSLETQIREVQNRNDPFSLKIPEERMQEILRNSTVIVRENLLACLSLKNNPLMKQLFHLDTLEQTARMVIQDKEKKAGVAPQERAMIDKRIRSTAIGQELVLRTAHAVLATLPEPERKEDAERASMILASRLLDATITEEALKLEEALNQTARHVPNK